MKLWQIKKVKYDFYPLYKEGDLFRITKLNREDDLLPIEAMRLKDKNIYGFEAGELR